MQSIGIGITTRNRSKVLELALLHFKTFWPENYDAQIVVIEDNSDREVLEKNRNALLESNLPFTYHYNVSRKGIAKSKNECLRRLQKCDYIFLFDDDCFPMKDGWHDLYIEAAKRTGVNHLIHLVDNIGLTFLREKNGLKEYDNCGGTLLFLTREVIKRVGAYNSNFGIYGYEHAEYSNRIYNAQLQNGHSKYVSPVGTEDYIYSLDFNLNHWGKLPELGGFKKEDFVSSLAGEESKIQHYINENGAVYSQNWGIYRTL